jgi:hypothetical protein
MKRLCAKADGQGSLFWEKPIIHCDSMASARNAYGQAAQELVWRLLGVRPVRINGGYAVNFDGWDERRREWVEVKSTYGRGRSGKVVVYDWRMGKERKVEEEAGESGGRVRYMIVAHDIKGEREDIFQKMVDREVKVWSLPAAVVHEHALRMPLMAIKRVGKSKREGYTREGYRDGYRNLGMAWMVEQMAWNIRRVENPLGSGDVWLHEMVEVDMNGSRREQVGEPSQDEG